MEPYRPKPTTKILRSTMNLQAKFANYRVLYHCPPTVKYQLPIKYQPTVKYQQTVKNQSIAKYQQTVQDE